MTYPFPTRKRTIPKEVDAATEHPTHDRARHRHGGGGGGIRRLSGARCSLVIVDLMRKRTENKQCGGDDLDRSHLTRPSPMLNCDHCSNVHGGPSIEREMISDLLLAETEEDALPSVKTFPSPNGRRSDGPGRPQMTGPKNREASQRPRPPLMSVSTLDDSLRSTDTWQRTHSSVSRSRSGSGESRCNNVSFGTVEIREYPRILGDNPAVTSGPPMTIDWGHDPATVVSVDLDLFEREKPPSREKYQIVVPRVKREEWLMKAGHSRGEIADAVRAVNRAKARRNQTIHNANLQRIEAMAESVRRKVRRAITGRPRDAVMYRRWVAEREMALGDAVEGAAADEAAGAEAEAVVAAHRFAADPRYDMRNILANDDSNHVEEEKRNDEDDDVLEELAGRMPSDHITNFFLEAEEEYGLEVFHAEDAEDEIAKDDNDNDNDNATMPEEHDDDGEMRNEGQQIAGEKPTEERSPVVVMALGRPPSAVIVAEKKSIGDMRCVEF